MFTRYLRISLLGVLLGVTAVAIAADTARERVVDGVAIYFGIVPSQMIRGHAPGHPERQMHGGVPAGESHIMVALFDDKSGQRLTGAEVNARVTGNHGLDVQKPLEPMVVAGAETYGNYFRLLGTGPYRIALRIRTPGAAREIHAEFAWKRE